MMTQSSSELIADYLGRLRAAAWPLDPLRAAELVEGIEEHIHDAVAEAGDDASVVRGILDRLGSPEEIAQAAASEDGFAVRPYPVIVQRPSLAHETWTVLLLTVGSFLIPFFAWLAGVVLLLTGKRWLWWEKLLGVLIVPGGPLGVLLLVGFATSYGSSTGGTCVVTQEHHTCTVEGRTHAWGGFGPALFLLMMLSPIAVNVFLWIRAKRRADLEQPRVLAA
jgi:uncharacterized membrane protein